MAAKKTKSKKRGRPPAERRDPALFEDQNALEAEDVLKSEIAGGLKTLKQGCDELGALLAYGIKSDNLEEKKHAAFVAGDIAGRLRDEARRYSRAASGG